MTDRSDTTRTNKQGELQIEILELNRETVQDLTEQEGDRARGGMVPATNRPPCCTDVDSGCF